MKKTYVEIDLVKEALKGQIPETEDGVKIIEGIMSNAVEFDTDAKVPENAQSIEEAVAAAQAQWEAENAKRWIKAFGEGVKPESNPNAVAQTGANDPQAAPIEDPPTESFWAPYSKEGVTNNALYS